MQDRKVYSARPLQVEAFQLGEPYPEWFEEVVASGIAMTHCSNLGTNVTIHPDMGQIVTGTTGDYIVKGVQGFVYAMSPTLFHLTYKECEGTDD